MAISFYLKFSKIQGFKLKNKSWLSHFTQFSFLLKKVKNSLGFTLENKSWLFHFTHLVRFGFRFG